MINKQTVYVVYTSDDAYRRWNDQFWETFDTQTGVYRAAGFDESERLEQELQNFLKDLKEINYES